MEPLKNLIPMKFDLNNKVAIVTGASQGIGETIAVEMANSGAYVICLARNKDALDSTINIICLLYTSPSPRDRQKSRMPSSA